MDFLGIGPLELLFIFIIILVVLGPNEMIKTGAVTRPLPSKDHDVPNLEAYSRYFT